MGPLKMGEVGRSPAHVYPSPWGTKTAYRFLSLTCSLKGGARILLCDTFPLCR